MANILVVDDELLVRATLRILLRSAGHRVAEARDGEEGVRACRGDAFDLVLCDLAMPVKDGLDAIAEIRRDFPGLPVIAVSGGWDGAKGDMAPAALRLGAVVALRKPFAAAALLGGVGEALGGPAAVSGRPPVLYQQPG